MKVVPAKVAPAKVAPAKVAPAKVAPAKVAPAKVAPAKAAAKIAAKKPNPPAGEEKISAPKGATPARAELGGPPLTILAAVAAAALLLFYGLVHIKRRRDPGPKMIINRTRPAHKSKAMPADPTKERRCASEPEEKIIETSVLDIVESPTLEQAPLESPQQESPQQESPQLESHKLEMPPLEFPSFELRPQVGESAEQKNQGGSSFAPLLRSIASGAQTGTLLAATRHGEKRILFRSGLISSATSSRGENKRDILADKIAHLLVRQGKMSSEKREEALKLFAGQKGGHLGDVLIGMGVINEGDLRQAMRQPAEDLISSLLLFSEGEFNFTRQELPPPGEEELALGVDFLLRAASESEEEWDRIRRNLRCAESILTQTEEGRNMLGKTRLTAPQQRVIAMVDGRKTVAEISASAPMLDLEVYKFLSSMTQASILKMTANISAETC